MGPWSGLLVEVSDLKVPYLEVPHLEVSLLKVPHLEVSKAPYSTLGTLTEGTVKS